MPGGPGATGPTAMADHDGISEPTGPSAGRAAAGAPSAWSARYGARHRWVRLPEFPPGISPPDKVRVYRRAGHYVLQWWDPGAGRNVADRVDGDLLAALARAREI